MSDHTLIPSDASEPKSSFRQALENLGLGGTNAETFVLECNTVPEIAGTEFKASIKRENIQQVRGLPLKTVQCETITAAQPRFQWNVGATGPRLDQYKALRAGNERYNLEVGMRTTYSGDVLLRRVEEQRVGIVTLTLDGSHKVSYWNDHKFPWWPMGGGTDQGDTAGLKYSYLLGNKGFGLVDGWSFRDVNLSLRLATGIPDKSSVVKTKDGTLYTHIEFSGVDQGNLDFNVRASPVASGRSQQVLTIGILVNSGALRHEVQSKLVHKQFDLPYLPKTDTSAVTVYLRLENL